MKKRVKSIQLYLKLKRLNQKPIRITTRIKTGRFHNNKTDTRMWIRVYLLSNVFVTFTRVIVQVPHILLFNID